MAPLVVQVILLAFAALCFFLELIGTRTTVSLVAFGLLFLTLSFIVPPINAIITR